MGRGRKKKVKPAAQAPQSTPSAARDFQGTTSNYVLSIDHGLPGAERAIEQLVFSTQQGERVVVMLGPPSSSVAMKHALAEVISKAQSALNDAGISEVTVQEVPQTASLVGRAQDLIEDARVPTSELEEALSRFQALATLGPAALVHPRNALKTFPRPRKRGWR